MNNDNKTESQGIATGAPDLASMERLAVWLYTLGKKADYADLSALIEFARRAQPAGSGELAQALRWALEWIDAVPADTKLPTMPGFDRDYVNGLLDHNRAALTHPSVSASQTEQDDAPVDSAAHAGGLWTVWHNGKSASADTMTACFAAARKLRTPEEQAAAANLAAAIKADEAENAAEQTTLPDGWDITRMDYPEDDEMQAYTTYTLRGPTCATIIYDIEKHRVVYPFVAALHARLPATQQPSAAPSELPAILFDGFAVYAELTRHLGKQHCFSPDAVSATLDAVVRLMQKDGAAPSVQQAGAPSDGSIYEAVSRRADPEGHAEAIAQMEAVLGGAGAPAQAQPDERALFEAHMREQGASDDDLKTPYNDGRYFWEKTADAWSIWQARAALSASPSAPAVQGKHDYDDPTLACSSCGLTMGESRTLGHIQLGILEVTAPAVQAAPDPCDACSGRCADCPYDEDNTLYTGAAPAGGEDARDAWQPIETVPKDGTEVLLYLQEPYSEVRLARWFSPWENWQEGEFPDIARDEYCGIGSACPSHWMPVPSKPIDRAALSTMQQSTDAGGAE